MDEMLLEKDTREEAEVTKAMAKTEKEQLLAYLQGFRAGQLMPKKGRDHETAEDTAAAVQ